MIDILVAAAKLAGIAPHLLLAVCYVESNNRNIIPTRPDNGTASFGVCQVKYSTAQFVAHRFNLAPVFSSDLLVPSRNAFYAALYLKYQLDRYNGNLTRALTAYNKGSSNTNQQSVYSRKVFKTLETQPWNRN